MSKRNDDLLKEVVAEAKSVRETAIANARITLEEQFTPQLQSLFSAKLDEMDDEEEELEFGSEEAPIEEPVEAPAEMPVDASMEAPVEAPVEEPVSDVVVDDEEELDEFSYESIIKEFENEEQLAEVEEPNLDDEEVDEEKAPVDELAKSSGIGSADNKKPSGDSFGSPSEYDTNKSHTVPNSKTTSPLSKDERESHDSQYVVKHDSTPSLNENEEADINAVIKELREELGAVDTEDHVAKLNEANETLGKYEHTIEFLRGKLNEVNLLNAKLLFTNKLFKAHTLNENQKLKVIDTLDRAGNLREAKLVFTTLNESFGSTPKPKKKTRKTINEGLASQTVESTKPSKETSKKILEEGSALSTRWAFLAGINKK